MSSHSRWVLSAAIFAAAAGSSYSQVLDRPTLYRLERTSTIARGCFPPCMCPSMETSSVAGTFRLELITVGNVFDFYEVTGIRFKFKRPTGEIVEVEGSGTYAVSTIADLQRMDVTLTVGSDPPTAYHSDDVPGGAAFPRIAVPVSINGGFCIDTVITVNAKPARRLYVEPGNLRWDAEASNTTSDVVFGDLRTLRQSAGAFDVATWACAAHAAASGAAGFPGTPSPNEGFWFLERATGDLYEDADAAQVGEPDPEIAAAPGACP
jgi:hypothetical protein